ncbi:MAG: glycosyltransferase family 2 protein [Alphaproteobacteria bacterium]|jgi:glycosyltransferase involved in cell wall biosynthesis|nr:glycosyltransferase family 2 protein [Alphaproteobacteria bacterium]MBT7942767.1 glycosyltransferase family 2 protein [Alphaproteobacteria bacterium]
MFAVLTTVYPAALPFLDDFLQGLKNQTDRDFILFIVNDGVEALGELSSGQVFEIRILEASGTAAALRRQGIAWAEKEGAEWIILVDSDDICTADRVARTRATCGKADGLFNDLIPFGAQVSEETPLLSPHFREPDPVVPHALVNSNFLGMSNTAARADLLAASAAQMPEDLIAFDWALFTRMTLDGATIRYMDGAPTRYRQHADNIASPFNISDRQVLKGVAIKARHYELFDPDGAPYDALATGFANLQARLNSDASFCQEYCHAVRKNSPDFPLWWEPMKLPEELGL